MSLFRKTLNKIFKTGNQKELDKFRPLVDEINNQEPNFKNLKDEELKAKTYLLKKILKKEDLSTQLFLIVLL
jgi:preprotein translocase subunit SecA